MIPRIYAGCSDCYLRLYLFSVPGQVLRPADVSVASLALSENDILKTLPARPVLLTENERL